MSSTNGAVSVDTDADTNINHYMEVVRKPNKRYCNRHRPGLICNKQADARKAHEIQQSMDSLDEKCQENISRIWSTFSASSAKTRQVILQGLLAQCCSPQLSAVSSMIEDLLRVDFIDNLPPELSVKILCYLDTASLCRAAQVCKKWKQLADDDIVWHRMCEQHIDRKCTKCGWGLPLLEKKRLRDSKKAIQARVEYMNSKKRKLDVMQCQDDASTPNSRGNSPELSVEPPAKKQLTRPWKDVYAERFLVERNWRTKKYKLKEFRDDESNLLCSQFDDQYLITGSYEGKVKVWDVESEKVIQVLDGHVAAVNAVKFDSTKLVTASSDRTVRIWNYKTGECISTFSGHDDKVLCLDFDRKLIASGSSDHTIKVWNFEEKSCLTLRGHSDCVSSVKIDSKSNTLYSASEDCTIKVWNLETKKCVRTFTEHVAQVTCVLPLKLDHLEGNDDYHHHDDKVITDECYRGGPTHLLSSSLDNTVKLWDLKTGQCVRTLFGHVEGVWSIAADNFRIITGANDKTVKVYDLQSGKNWHTFTGHGTAVCCVGLNDTRFASTGDDGVVKMYCFDDFDE